MLKFLRKNSSALLFILFLAACAFLFLHRDESRGGRLTSFKHKALLAWLPVQDFLNKVVAFPQDTLNAINQLKTLRQQVTLLQVENQQLQMDLADQRSNAQELARLQEILQIKSRMPGQARIARIVAHDPSTWDKSFVVDVGSNDGVMVDSPVVSQQGLVGRVLETTPDHSRVLLITDGDSGVAGVDQRSLVTGIAAGTGLNRLRFNYVSSTEDIKKDDIIVSSGIGGVFPKGYPIGAVISVSTSETGLNLVVDVVPAVDFAALDYVFILPPVNTYE